MMSAERSMVVVGAGEAGTAAAIALREGGCCSRIILIGTEATLPYERPPLSKGVIAGVDSPAPKFLVTDERLAALAIEYFQGRTVLSIDRAKRIVVLDGHEHLPYDRLLLATGARPRTLSAPVSPKSQTCTLRTYSDALNIRQAIRAGSKVVVIGGGFIGLEVAASAISKGADVTVLEGGPRLLTRSVPAYIASRIQAKHESAGVTVETGTLVASVDALSGQSTVTLVDGRTYLADLVLVAVGAIPNTELAEAADLTIDNGIATDDTLATSDPYIFAAGDCCSFVHRLYGERIRLEVWRNAWQQGVAAAANMLGSSSPYESVPWFWSDQYDETLQIAGIYHEKHLPVVRDLGERGQVCYYLDTGGRLVAACGFGNLGAISKEIRFAESIIAKRIAPNAEALADPSVSLKSMLI